MKHQDKTKLPSNNSSAGYDKQYRTLVENTPDIVTRWDKGLKLLFANSAFEKLAQQKNENMIGKTLLEIGRPAVAAVPFMESLRKAFDESIPIEYYSSLEQDNSVRYYYTRMVPEADNAGEVESILCIARDITEVRLTELSLQEKNSALTEAQALGHIGSFSFDYIKNEVRWSDELYRLMGVPQGQQLSFETAIAHYVPRDRAKLATIAEEALRERKGFEMEAEFRRHDNNELRNIFIKAVVKVDEADNVTGLHGIVQDITNRKKAEEKIDTLNKELLLKNRQLESVNSELSTFNAIAANDYKETLQALYTNLEHIIKTDAARLSDPGKANIRKAQGAIQRLKLLTDDIVSFSRLPVLDGGQEEVDLNDVFSGILEDLSGKIAGKGAIVHAGYLPKVKGAPLLLSLLFYHLLDNAVKFSADDRVPKVTVSCDIVTAADLPEQLPGDRYYRITFGDNGIGFDALRYRRQIFDIFTRLHEKGRYRGSGIGLAVCKKVMDLHNGYITADSRQNAGSEFCCYFPAATGPEAQLA